MVPSMSRTLALFLAALTLLLPGGAALAQSRWGGARVVASVSWVEEWDPATGQWVRVDDSPAVIAPAVFDSTTTVSSFGNVTITETVRDEPVRFIGGPVRTQPGGQEYRSQFGPFRVLDDRRAALVASTNAASPDAFAAMLAAHPGLEVIEFADAPGTSNDLANLALGRAIRAAGLATHVPTGGSARSGAVELFMAGTRRTIAPGALFAVHSWRDEKGREPADFAPDAPENRLYLDYYAEMGMTADEARGFYTMTNSVPHSGALWLEGAEMARWIVPRGSPARAFPPQLEPVLRLALARSGKALVDAARMKWAVRADGLAALRLVYADRAPANLAVIDAPLLDSRLAFP